MNFLTTQQAAEELGVSRRLVQQLIKAEKLKAQRAGRDWIIDPRDLDKVRDRPGPGRRRVH